MSKKKLKKAEPEMNEMSRKQVLIKSTKGLREELHSFSIREIWQKTLKISKSKNNTNTTSCNMNVLDELNILKHEMLKKHKYYRTS